MFRNPLFWAALVAQMTANAVAASPQAIDVFAAASLKEALDDAAAAFSTSTGSEVVVSYAGTSALSRQIAAGAPVDVFISASVDWMDTLEGSGNINPATRVDLIGNSLVMIGGPTTRGDFDLTDPVPILRELQRGPLAMALVDAVPAGIYGRQALETAGLWETVVPHVAQTDNVRAALTLVSIGAAPLGIVYASDAQADPRVSIKVTFPADSHSEIVYPAAITHQSDTPDAKAFLDYLQSDAAHKIFSKHGFSIP